VLPLLWQSARARCNNGIGGFHKNIVTFRGPKLPDCSLAQKMCLKKCSSLVQLKSWQVWTRGAKTQNGRKFPQNRPSQAQNISESKFSCIFQQPLNRDKYMYLVYVSWEKVPAFLKSHPGTAKNKKPRRITIFMFCCTFEQPLYFWKISTAACIVTPYKVRSLSLRQVWFLFWFVYAATQRQSFRIGRGVNFSAMGFSLVFRERVSETLGNRCCFRMFLFLFSVSVRNSPPPYFLSFFLP